MQYVSRPHHYIGNRRQENNSLGRIGVSGQISRAGSFNSNGFVKSVEAVVDVLRREGPTHYRDIYEKVAETGVIVVGKDPAAVLLARFSRDSRVHRVGSGTYDLIADAT